MSGERILVVDDEPEIRRLLQEILEDEGYAVVVAANAAQARAAIRRQTPDLVLLDIWMPEEDGVTLLKSWNAEKHPPFAVIMMSGHGTVETAVEATRQGALDYIEKPISLTRLLLTVRRGLEMGRAGRQMPPAGASRERAPQLVGSSAVMRTLRARVELLAPRHEPVVAMGEPGSGRTTLLRVLHGAGPRPGGPLVDLAEAARAEQFDASLETDGADAFLDILHGASGGSLYLGELLRLTLDQQERLYERLALPEVGAQDVRVLATLLGPEGLDDAVARGRLIGDLAELFRVGQIRVPPLREHVEDVPELLQYHTDRLHQDEGLNYRHFTVASQNFLRYHHWPGNIAELRALVRLVLTSGQTTEIEPAEAEDALRSLRLQADSALSEVPSGYGELFELSLKDARERFERAYLVHWLAEMGGNISRLAEHAGVERTHLYRKLRALGIEPRKERRKRP
ncbi:sigma-54-dependent transcriptional regulator [Acidihalobacter prosperus]|uniref:Nitrogen regulation protein NtrX n=1 Tax=Acidihalobacter prosperus TaxID=160660 RepID=A0A1A6C137_9GAMM|nr:sigma-54 dependent transcriptional regulator [Acidihalobacter prosperus]OBS08270.1 Nitrogen regulation protein NtrX [Acidihalobacter prosperus]